jgi:hypothetical protein
LGWKFASDFGGDEAGFWGFSLFFVAIQSRSSFKKVLGRNLVLFCFCGFLPGSDSSMIFIYLYIYNTPTYT